MRSLNTFIDHTLLKADGTKDEIVTLCEEAMQYSFAAVCILPCWVKLAADILRGTKVNVCSVVGFPLGGNTTTTKLFEAEQLVINGAQELDCVLNIGALKSDAADAVKNEIASLVAIAEGRTVKIILETCLLTDEEKIRACLIAKDAGASYVKTSTGFSKSGATLHDIALMRKTVGQEMGVKASGGIRDFETALKMVQAGATRIGTSAGVAIASHSGTPSHNSY